MIAKASETLIKRLITCVHNNNFRWNGYFLGIGLYYHIPIKIFYGDENIRYIVLYRRDKFVIDKIIIFYPVNKNSFTWNTNSQLTKICDSQNYNEFGITDELFAKMSYKRASTHVQGYYNSIWLTKEFDYLKYPH